MKDSNQNDIFISLLGRFEVSRGGKILRQSDWKRRKASALLQRLALERRLLKDQAIEFLWPGSSPKTGANNLYRTIHALRSTLDSALGADTAQATFAFSNSVLTITDFVWVDAHEFKRLCTSRFPDDKDKDYKSLKSAIELYTGDLLPDALYEEWTQSHRSSLIRLFHQASLNLAEHSIEIGDFQEAINLLSELLEKDHVDGTVHRELMRAYALAGRRHEALRQYQAYVEVLASELDISPEAQTEELYLRIVKGELDTAKDFKQKHPITFIPNSVDIENEVPLVGRDKEIEVIRSLIRKTYQGKGQTILFAGETGVGKTRLALEAAREAASMGMPVLFGASYEQEGQWPFQPFIEAIDRYLKERQLPVDENPITNFKKLGSDDFQQEQWALFSSTADFLIKLSADTPVLLLVDDLHAADDTSLYLFHFLVRQTINFPVILMATYRSDIPTTVTSPLGTLLNSLLREHLSETIDVKPLTKNSVETFVRNVLDDLTDDDLVNSIFEMTGGNPFYVQEVALSLLRNAPSGQQKGYRHPPEPEESIEFPSRLNDLLRERVINLGQNVEEILTVAAVLGREFNFDILLNMTSLSDGELLNALDAALYGKLVEETKSGYRFRHSLIRHTLYNALSKVRKSRLHALAASVLQERYTQMPESYSHYIEVLAFHYDLSDQREKAVGYLVEAGENAAAVYAFEVAIDYLERALSLIEEIGWEDPGLQWRIYENLGWWGIALADTQRAVPWIERALALYADGEWQPTRQDRARLHRAAAVALITAGDLSPANDHLDAALGEIDESEDAVIYTRVLYNKAQFHWHRNEYQKAFDVAQHSLSIAERVGDADSIARAFEMLALACHSQGEWKRGIAFEDERSAMSGPGLDVTDAFDVHL